MKQNVALNGRGHPRRPPREGLCDLDAERTALMLFVGGDALNQVPNQRYYAYETVLRLYADVTMQGLLPCSARGCRRTPQSRRAC